MSLQGIFEKNPRLLRIEDMHFTQNSHSEPWYHFGNGFNRGLKVEAWWRYREQLFQVLRIQQVRILDPENPPAAPVFSRSKRRHSRR